VVDDLAPECGWALLAQVQRILNFELVLRSSQGTERLLSWERLIVELGNGQQRVLYRVWIGWNEEYLCNIGVDPPQDAWI